jgi:hypothetical protein
MDRNTTTRTKQLLSTLALILTLLAPTVARPSNLVSLSGSQATITERI